VPSREKPRSVGDERIGDGKVAAPKETKDVVCAGLRERLTDRLVDFHELNTWDLIKRTWAGMQGMVLEREMKPQSLVYVEHEVCRNLADALADALDSHAPDLLGLSFRILVKACCRCGQQHLKRVHALNV